MLKLFLPIISIFIVSHVFAQTGKDLACGEFNSAQDVLSCLEAVHPESIKLNTTATEVEGVKKSAEQFPNPTLEFDTLKGKQLGETQSETNLGVSQLIEIGGKRRAKKSLGEASAQRLNASAILGHERIKIDAILKLVRYRQVLAEIAVLEETMSTYGKVNKQFSSRPRLSPDQRASSTIFRLALGDYRHRLATLTSERNEIEMNFRSIQGFNFESAKSYLPKLIKNWPEMKLEIDTKQGPRFTLIDSNLKEALANYEFQSANAWPDPTISLYSREIVNGSQEYRMYGVGVSLPLPFWNLNGGAKSQALAQKLRAEVDYQVATRTLPNQYKNLLSSYNNAITALRQNSGFDESEREHRETERLFYQGSISGTQIIELHRQLLEFTTTANDLERDALEALLTLMSYQGRLSEFKLE